MLSKCSYFQGVRIFISLFWITPCWFAECEPSSFCRNIWQGILCNVVFIYFMSNPHVIVGTLDVYYTVYTSWRVLLFSKGGIETWGFHWLLCRGPFDWGRYILGPSVWGRYARIHKKNYKNCAKTNTDYICLFDIMVLPNWIIAFVKININTAQWFLMRGHVIFGKFCYYIYYRNE